MGRSRVGLQDGCWCGLDRRHGAVAARRHGPVVRLDLRAVDAGVVPAGVHFRSRPSARRGRFSVPHRTGRSHVAARCRRRRSWSWSTSTTPIIEVHGHAKQGAWFGYTRVRRPERAAPDRQYAGLRADRRGAAAAEGLVRVSRERREATGRRRAEDRHVDCAALPRPAPVLLRADSAFYGSPTIGAAVRRRRTACRSRSGMNPEHQGRDRQHRRGRVDRHRVHRRDPRRAARRADLPTRRSLKIGFTAFTSGQEDRAGPGPAGGASDHGPERPADPNQARCSTSWRFHALFTTPTPTCSTRSAADKAHRGHAIIEQVHADLKNGPAGTPALREVHGQRPGCLRRDGVQPHPRRRHARRRPLPPSATTGTIRRTLISVPARDRLLSTPTDPAPAHALAVGDGVAAVVHPQQQPTRSRDLLTTRPRRPPPRTWTRPTPEVGNLAMPSITSGPTTRSQPRPGACVGGSRLSAFLDHACELSGHRDQPRA